MAWTRVVHLASTDSTNTHLMRALTAGPGEWPHLSVVVADAQTAGRGRAGRAWHSRPGESLTASVVLRLDDDAAPPVTWVPLLVGVAVRRALARWVPTVLKWPNDVLLATDSAEGAAPPDRSRAFHGEGGPVGSAEGAAASWGWTPKLGGILCELHPSGAVVAGVGINCRTSREDLPVPWAASIATATGGSPAPLDVLEALGEALPAVLADWAGHAARVRAEYEEACVVVGEQVTVTGGHGPTEGRAVGIGLDGALLVDTARGRLEVTAGDVEHVR